MTPKRTLASDRFMALHMMLVRMMPEAPTSEPAMIRTVLLITKPVAAAARPEYELRRAITTGMSAPPMEMVSTTPSTPATATRSQKSIISSGCITTRTPSARDAAPLTILTASIPGKRSFLISSMPAMAREQTMMRIASRSKLDASANQMPPPATAAENGYLTSFCQACSFHFTHRNSASLPKAT